MPKGYTIYNHSQISLASQNDSPRTDQEANKPDIPVSPFGGDQFHLLVVRLPMCPHGTGKRYYNESCLHEVYYSEEDSCKCN